MGAGLKRYPLASALVIAAAVLLAIVAFELASGASHKREANGAPQRVAVVDAKLLPPAPPASEQAYPETGARPLFTPTRRPAPAAASTGSSTMNKGQFVLNGVTIVGALRIALLREKTSGRVVRLELGKEVNGMTLAQIEPDRVTFVQGGDQEVLSLQIQKGAAAPQAAAAPAGPFASAGGAPPPSAAQPQPPPLIPNPAARATPPGAPVGFGPAPPPPNDATAAAAAAAAAAAQAAQSQQTTPLSPDELLARRRARRSQQTQ